MTIPGSANPLLLKAPAGGGGGEYTIERSVRFNSSDSAYLSRTPASAGNRKTWTWAGWVKRSKLSTPSTLQFLFTGTQSGTGGNSSVSFYNDNIYFRYLDSTASFTTTAVFRDTSAWYHIVAVADTDNATANDRLIIYVNGVRQTGTISAPTLGQSDGYINFNNLHFIGTQSTTYSDFYLADCFLIDGQALDPTSFGEFDSNGIWQPKEYTGDYGFLSVANATGALPIYNTTDTLGAVKGTGTRTDSNSSSIVLAIPMDGANNGTTFTDESATIKGSGSAKGITRNGDTKTSTAQSKYYGSSGYFDGTGDTLTLAASSDFAFGTNDFTIETWIYSEDISGSTQKGFFQLSNSSGGLNTSLNTGVAIYFGSGGYLTFKTGGITVISSLALSQNTWYHIAVTRSGDVHRLFVDGIERGSVTSSRSDITQQNVVVGGIYSTSYLYQGYLNDFRVYKGVAKYTSNFTIVTTNNSFHLPFDDNSTAAALGTDTSGAGNDWAANNISVADGAGNDSLVDVPQNGTETDTGVGGEVRSNYATLNPLVLSSNGSLSEGNLKFNSSSNYNNARSTIGVTSGKWYAEFTLDSGQSYIGIALSELPAASYGGNTIYGWVYHPNSYVYHNSAATSYGASFTTGDIIGLAFDADNRTAIWYKNGSSQGSYSLGSNAKAGDIFFFIGGGAAVASYSSNFGQRPFAYTAPSGFKALCTANLPAPVVTKPSEYMDVKLYTGNGSTQTISGLEFSPDLVWIKGRSVAYNHRVFDTVRGTGGLLYTNTLDAETAQPNVNDTFSSFNSDGFSLGVGVGINGSSVPYAAWCWDAGSNSSKTYTVTVPGGIGGEFYIDGDQKPTINLEEGSTYTFDQSDSSNSGHPFKFSETSDGTHGAGTEYTTNVTTFGTPGSAGAYTRIEVAASAPTLYYYCSNHSAMGGQINTNSTAGASNFDGSIPSVVRANPTAGFSIVSYTGSGSNATVGHGLGVAPAMIMFKKRSDTQNWVVYHSAMGATKALYLEQTVAAVTASNFFQDTQPTSSVFSLGTGNGVNTISQTFIAYCFAPVESYSAFGSYTGNGSADGPFVFTNHRPRWILLKRTDTTSNWTIIDTAREGYNVDNDPLYPNLSDVEGTTDLADILSNGFKLRSADASVNASAGTYIYASFAEQPFQYSRAR